MRKKISFFIPSLEGGGAEKNTINLLRNINREEYDLSLVLAEKKGDFIKYIPQELEVFDLMVGSRAYILVFLKLINYLRKKRPDILVSSFPHFNIICLIAKKLANSKTKIIITEHVGLIRLYKNASSALNSFFAKYIMPFFIRFTYPTADAIICVSQGVANDLNKITGKNLNLSAIHNPIDIQEIVKMSEVPVSEKLFADKKTPVIIMVGRLVKEKID